VLSSYKSPLNIPAVGSLPLRNAVLRKPTIKELKATQISPLGALTRRLKALIFQSSSVHSVEEIGLRGVHYECGYPGSNRHSPSYHP
jgi:hypothetical protein